MKTKKIISFLLMLTILFTMNIAPVLAEDAETHTLTTSASDGGTISAGDIFKKNGPICGEGEHNHGDGKCDLSEPNCGGLHTHDDGCYDVCPLEQHLEHDDSCYDNQPTCGKDEHDCKLLKCTRITCGEEAHVHTLDCVGLVCTKEVHIHNPSCYKLEGLKIKLKCGKEAHIHDDVFDDCYDKVCGKHTHVHVPSCHTYGDCGKSHKHSDSCYKELCGGIHKHDDDCRPLICKEIEHSEEDHSIENGCYKCSLTEHSHDEGCFAWPETTVTATADEGYYVSSMTGTGNNEEIPKYAESYTATISMNEDRTVHAEFTKKPELMVSFNQGDSTPGVTNVWDIYNPGTEDIECEWIVNGNESQAGTRIIAADTTEKIETNVQSNPDYIEISWINSSDDTGNDSDTATQFAGITAVAQNGSFKDDNGNGQTLGSNPTYYFVDTTVKIKAIPNSGYHFVNDTWEIVPEWVVQSTNGDTATLEIPGFEPQKAAYKGAIITLAVIGDDDGYYNNDNEPEFLGITVEGKFQRNSTPSRRESEDTMYTLNVDVEGPGSVSPTSGSYESGTNVQLNPTPDEGAQFVGWFGRNGDDVSDTNRILMNGSKSIIARFEEIPAEEEDFIDEDIPESGDIVEVPEETIPDEYVPQAGETLPQTGGIPMELLFGIGFALIGGGVSLNKKVDKKDKK